MNEQSNLDPVDRIIKECHRGELEANRIYHIIAEEHQQHICQRPQSDNFCRRYISIFLRSGEKNENCRQNENFLLKL